MDNVEVDQLYLCSDENVQKVLKKNVDLELNPDLYDYIVLVGSEAMKYYLGSTGVQSASGTIFRDKYIPLINPSMIYFKPELKRPLNDSIERIKSIVQGTYTVKRVSDKIARGIKTKEAALEYIQEAFNYPVVALDCETTSLYPRNGYVQGISLCYTEEYAAYISSDCIDSEVEELLHKLFLEKIVVFHNAKFDRGMLNYHFGWEFPNYDDTMLLHYMLDEQPGGHGLKELAAKHTPFGHYEEPLYDFIAETIKAKGIKKTEFYWGWIPFEVMYPYAAMDSLVTLILYNKMKPAVYENKRFVWVYENILIKGSTFLEAVQDNGVPFSRERLDSAEHSFIAEIEALTQDLVKDPTVLAFEAEEGIKFNPGSVLQLRKLLFDYRGLKPTGRLTGKGEHSTDAKSLTELAKLDPLPEKILKIRKASKILNTYITKIKHNLDMDDRLRTGFNLTSTTSGRLSSSGKLNMQQLPRDEFRVKGCIVAKPGYKIVSMDLKTAEMYYAAVLSGDTALMDVFISGGDFHSAIAKKVFHLDCSVDDVKKLHGHKRQASKAVSFGILFGSGAAKVAQTVTEESKTYFSLSEAQQTIEEYFEAFPKLAKWIKASHKEIMAEGYIYSKLGRKRRLIKAKENKDMGEVRSGFNFLIQSTASDINLLGAIEMQEYLNSGNMSASIFALVHDSIVAEVPEDQVEAYCEKLKSLVQKDRGVSIPNCPIGVDFEIGNDYSINKYEDYLEEILRKDMEGEEEEDEDIEIQGYNL